MTESPSPPAREASRRSDSATLQDRRPSFLLALGDRLRNITDARGITDATAEALGRHMNVCRVVYGEIDERTRYANVWSEWTDGTVPSIVGRHHLDSFGPTMVQGWREGKLWRVDDVETDPRDFVRAGIEAYRAIGIRGALCPPLIRGGRLVGVIAVQTAAPHHWTDDEAALVQEVADRTWDAIERARAEEHLRVVVAELQHRSRNLIAVVRSIANQALASSDSLEAFRVTFQDRLSALSRVQGLLSRSDQDPITIEMIVRMELAALGADDALGRMRLSGPDVPLQNAMVQTLSLALHELATNARKYGALANENGQLSVEWRVVTPEDGAKRLTLDWTETWAARPPGTRPADALPENGSERRGYGRELIERVLPHSLGAITQYELNETSVRCMIDMPLNRRGSRGQAITSVAGL
jgi:two-component sensor histidine kinase